jgi:hypothetical protein
MVEGKDSLTPREDRAPTSGKMVWCVICMDDDLSEVVHIFSSPEKREAFMVADRKRNHVAYDYVIDHPERMEEAAQ